MAKPLRASISLSYHAVVFRRFQLLFALVSLVAISARQGCLAAAATPTTLKSYPLHGTIGSADISPDEKLVAIESLSGKPAGDSGASRFRPVVELWDFRANRLVARTTLNGPEVPRSTNNAALYALGKEQFVRFTGDGKNVVAYFDDEVWVLRTDDLSVVASLHLIPPASHTFTRNLKRYGVQRETYAPSIQGLETSPKGTLMAVLWSGAPVRGNPVQGRLDIYDIPSGHRFDMWRVPNSWSPDGVGHDLAWGPFGTYIYMARPNSTPCLRPDGGPDVFGLNVQTGALKTTLNTGLMVGDIAVTPTEELLAVDTNCVGRHSNLHPKMVVYDLRSGKHWRNVRVKGTGVRYRVAVSRNGKRAVAWTSEVKCSLFDWLDMTCARDSVKPIFTMWHLPDFRVMATSQVLPDSTLTSQFEQGDGVLRISSTGRYVLMYGTNGFVFEVP